MKCFYCLDVTKKMRLDRTLFGSLWGQRNDVRLNFAVTRVWDSDVRPLVRLPLGGEKNGVWNWRCENIPEFFGSNFRQNKVRFFVFHIYIYSWTRGSWAESFQKMMSLIGLLLKHVRFVWCRKRYHFCWMVFLHSWARGFRTWKPFGVRVKLAPPHLTLISVAGVMP